MTEHDIRERLTGVSIRPSAEARERAAAAARGVPLPRSGGSGAALRIAGIVLLLVLFTGLTPPGRSLAEAVEDFVGIGDDPTAPAGVGLLEKNNQSVIGLGEAPNGARYELVKGSETGDPVDPRTTCYYVSFPDLTDPPRVFNCLTRAALQGLQVHPLQVLASLSSDELGPGAELTIMGSTASSVASIDVEYEGADGTPLTTSPDLAPLDSVKAFVAFLPFESPDVEPVPSGDVVKQHEAEMANADLYAEKLRSIVVTAKDENGQVLSAITLGDIPNIGFSLASVAALPEPPGR